MINLGITLIINLISLLINIIFINARYIHFYLIINYYIDAQSTNIPIYIYDMNYIIRQCFM